MIIMINKAKMKIITRVSLTSMMTTTIWLQKTRLSKKLRPTTLESNRNLKMSRKRNMMNKMMKQTRWMKMKMMKTLIMLCKSSMISKRKSRASLNPAIRRIQLWTYKSSKENISALLHTLFILSLHANSSLAQKLLILQKVTTIKIEFIFLVQI